MSNMVIAIKTIQSAIQSKQYNQDKPRGNDYIVKWRHYKVSEEFI